AMHAYLKLTSGWQTVDPAGALKLLDTMLERSASVIDSTALNKNEKVEFFHDLIVGYFALNTNKDRKPGYDKVREVLDKHAAGTSLLHTVAGDFYASYAWDARGTGTADTVSDEQARVMGARLRVAAAELEEAWALDNQNSTAPARRITVAMGLG